MDFDIKEWWQEITGYSVGCGAWLWNILPGTCEGWTHIFAFLIVAVTFIFITAPKAFGFTWWFKKKKE